MSDCPRCHDSGVVLALHPPIGFRSPCPERNGAGLGVLVVDGWPADVVALVADPSDPESPMVVVRNVGTGEL